MARETVKSNVENLTQDQINKKKIEAATNSSVQNMIKEGSLSSKETAQIFTHEGEPVPLKRLDKNTYEVVGDGKRKDIKIYDPLLRNIALGLEDAITTVYKDGLIEINPGYDMMDVAEKGTFEDVLLLEMSGRIPTKAEVKDLKRKFAEYTDFVPELKDALITEMKNTSKKPDAMTLIRRLTGVLEDFDPQPMKSEESAWKLFAINYVLQAMVHKTMEAKEQGKAIAETTFKDVFIDNGKHAQKGDKFDILLNSLQMIHGKNHELLNEKNIEETLRIYKIESAAHASHGFAVSRLAAAVAGSAETDIGMERVAQAGFGALQGNLHGGANVKAMEQQDKYLLTRTEEDLKERAKNFITKVKDIGERIMGMGHGVYITDDPRYNAQKRLIESSDRLKNDPGIKQVVAVVDAAREDEQYGKNPKKRSGANVDILSGHVLTKGLKFRKDTLTVFFGVSRALDWYIEGGIRYAGKLMRGSEIEKDPKNRDFALEKEVLHTAEDALINKKVSLRNDKNLQKVTIEVPVTDDKERIALIKDITIALHTLFKVKSSKTSIQKTKIEISQPSHEVQAFIESINQHKGKSVER